MPPLTRCSTLQHNGKDVGFLSARGGAGGTACGVNAGGQGGTGADSGAADAGTDSREEGHRA
eukprot:6064780-Prymnesium_polylepis.1